jgi:glucokinase
MYLLFDIGGTKMRLAISKDGITFDEPKVVSTPPDFDTAKDIISDIFGKLTNGKKPDLVVGGIPGVLDRDRNVLVKAPNLSRWVGKPIKAEFEQLFSATTFLTNDADLAGLGEAVNGAGKNFQRVAYLTISTGIGGVLIADGKLGESNLSYEPGHQIIDMDGSIWPESRQFEEFGVSAGSLSSYISGKAIQVRFGKEPKEVTDKKVWNEICRILAVGINNTIVFWNPDVLVLGGGMMQSSEISVEILKSNLKKILKIFTTHPEIKKAELGDLGGLHGALAYLKQIQK